MLLATTLLALVPQSTWFVDPAGVGPGTGTPGDPYTRVDFAAAQPTTQTGDTLVLASGSYPGEEVDLGARRLTLRAAPGATPVLMGSNHDAIARVRAGGALTAIGLRFVDGRGSFDPNSQFPQGGAVFSEGGDVTLDGCSFADCTAHLGGAVAVLAPTGPVDVLLRDVTVSTCGADARGGALYASGCRVRIEGCELSAFSAFDRGGVVYVEQTGSGSLHVADSMLNGSAYDRGGAICAVGAGTVHLVDSQITGQSREDYFGGGVFVDGPAFEAERVTFLNCAAISGGAVFIDSPAGTPTSFRGCRFENNRTASFIIMSSGDGGAIHAIGGAMVERCVFVNNRADHQPWCRGGALFGAIQARYCTFVGNDARDVGATAVLSAPGSLDSCLVVDSLTGTTPPVSPGTSVAWSLLESQVAGPGNAVGTPDFWSLGSLRLLPGSRGIDLANPADGVDPDGTRRDAGAFPFDRDWCGFDCDGPLGAPACVAAPNSTGITSLIYGFGSTDPAVDRVVLNVDRLPTNAIGYFIASRTQAFVPGAGGSAGNLCVGGSVLRFANRILTATPAAGTVSFRPVVNDLPGGAAVQPGEVWTFQLWHRDAGLAGPTSNFSPSLAVQF